MRPARSSGRGPTVRGGGACLVGGVQDDQGAHGSSSMTRVTGVLPPGPPTQPPRTAENVPRSPPAAAISSPPGRNFGQRRGRRAAPACPRRCRRRRARSRSGASRSSSSSSACSRARSQPASAKTARVLGRRRRAPRRTRARAWGARRRAGPAASERASDSGVARDLVDDALRRPRRRTASPPRRPAARRASTDSGSQGEPSSSSAKQNANLPGLAEGRAVDLAGPAAADVADHQLQRAPDRRVGPVALPERVAAACSCRSGARSGR